MIQTEVVGVRCELATPRGQTHRHRRACSTMVSIPAIPINRTDLMLVKLRSLVTQGWVFVMGSPMRAYCPDHADRVTQCSCRHRQSRERACPVHGVVRELVWTAEQIPEEVLPKLARYDAGRNPQ